MQLSRGAYAAVRPAAPSAPPSAPSAPPTALQIESWRLLWEEHAADADAQAALAAWERACAAALPEARSLVERFVAGELELEAFRATLDRRAKSDWRALALRGPAGAMLLNQLAKHVSDHGALTAALRRALAVPTSAAAASETLRAWVAAAAPWPVPAARLVAFAAACWHVQAPERWPAYQPSARRALAAEDALFRPTGDAVADYVAFRMAFLAVAAAIGVRAAELEHLCRRARPLDDVDSPDPVDDDERAHPPRRASVRRAPRLTRPARATERVADRVADRVAERPPVYDARPATPGHTHVQWQLARLGHALGLRVWIAANDHARTWDGETLGTLSLPRLPRLGLDDESERLVRLIDVVWLSGRHRVAAAFEVERTTAVHSGILRMADLAALAPNLSFPMYVVAPADRLPKVRRELARPSLQALGLHRRCGFFSAEALLGAAEAIARFGGGAEAISRLAEHVSPT